MNEATVQKLLELNRTFYQTFAPHFSATRVRIQPGVAKILEDIPKRVNILDLGCGNGNVPQALIKLGFQGHYIGLDASTRLVEIAKKKVNIHTNFHLLQHDLASDHWDLTAVTIAKKQWNIAKFDLVFGFATFHHLPGQTLHQRVFKKIYDLLVENGRVYHSHWQFLNSERLRRRIQSWDSINLSAKEVDEGDYLLDWRRGGQGLRFVHHFSQDELASLAKKTGFNVIESFISDGKGGNLGLYQVWQKTTR